jgi:hypothetical protein
LAIVWTTLKLSCINLPLMNMLCAGWMRDPKCDTRQFVSTLEKSFLKR